PTQATPPTHNTTDGPTRNRQTAHVAQSTDAKTAKPGAGIDSRLLETSRHGMIPKIAPDGTRPAEAYARPVKPDRVGGPRIAIVIGGLGVGANGTSEALAKLPGPVTFAFAPVLREIVKRGLIYVDDGASPRSLASQISGANSAAFAKADIALDAVPSGAEIDAALARLEAAARSRGAAIGMASALPVSID